VPETTIDTVTSRYLGLVDDALPGFVEGLYVVGSAALDAWQPEHSDVDAVIVTSRPAGADDAAALARVHAAMPDRPHLDGVYLDRAAFAERPSDQRVVPYVVDGQLHADEPCDELNPVLWLTLRRYGIPVRDPAATHPAATYSAATHPGAEGAGPDGDVDVAALRRYNLDNLRGYWQALAAHTRGRLADRDPDLPLPADLVVWPVLGPARLHYTLAHLDVISKARAGAYLAELFPQWASLADRAIRWRAGEPESFTTTDLYAAVQSVDAVADDAWTRWGDSEG
jgi:hypothetical protein